MKKYLLTALLGVFGLCSAFASADSVSVVKDGTSYNPNQIYFVDGGSITTSIASVPSQGCGFGNVCSIIFTQGTKTAKLEWDSDMSSLSVSQGSSTVFDAGYVSLSCGNRCFESINLSSSMIGESPSVPDNSGTLLPGGEGDLSGIISGLNSVIDEFLPYLVYIGLGLITATIGFIAIRWLVNRTSTKVRGTFSSGKRRR